MSDLAQPEAVAPAPPARSLAWLNPVRLLFGPIFLREMRSAGRRTGTYWIRSGYALGLTAIVTLVFLGVRDVSAGSGGAARLQELQTIAPQIMVWVMWIQFAGLALVAPVLTGGAICNEKRAKTLPALMTTPMTAAQIACGKLTGGLVQLAILALVPTPLLLAIRLFGGLEAGTVVASACLAFSTVLLAAALALLYSVWQKRAMTASLFAILTLVLLMGAPVCVEATLFWSAQSSGHDREFQVGVLGTCAPAALFMVTIEMLEGAIPIPGSVDRLWQWASAYNFFWAVAATFGASIALRRTMLAEAAGSAPPPVARRRRRKAEADAPPVEAAPPPDESLRETRRSREVGDRPVLWRELRLPMFGSRRQIIALSAVLAVIFGWTYWRVSLASEVLHMVVGTVGILVVLLQAAFLTTGGISNEREGLTWGVLLTTPLTARQIVVGKFLGALRRQWFAPAVLFLHFGIAAVGGVLHPILFIHLLAVIVGPVAFLSGTGVLFSLVCRKGVVASVCNILLALTLWLGVFLALVLISIASSGWESTEPLAEFFMTINPVYLVPTFTEPAAGLSWDQDPTYRLGIAGGRTDVGTFTLIVATIGIAYGLAGIGAVALAIHSFPRASGRSS